MTLNNLNPRTSMKRFSRSTVSATDLLLSLVMTEDCALSNIRDPLPSLGISFERRIGTVDGIVDGTTNEVLHDATSCGITPALTCCRKRKRVTSGRWRQSGAARC